MKATMFSLLAALCVSATYANNISVSGVSFSGQNALTNTININYSVGWENSWRTSTNENNYDGAWIFVKYRLNGTGEWRHCTLEPAGSTVATGGSYSIPADHKGAFLYRSADGIGDVSYAGNVLVWNYGADLVADNATVEVKVFALEMVYIPTGAYWLGTDGGTETNSFKAGTTSNAYHVTGAGAIDVSDSGLSFNGMGSGASIPASFPNGYNAFWIMKYECSQQQYADFVNMVGAEQVAVLTADAAGDNFDALTTWPNFAPHFAERAMNNISLTQYLAFADWAGLRPFSEMEFEKACRGVDILPVANEFAWGSTNLTPLVSVTNSGLTDEAVATPVAANCIYNLNPASPIYRPARVGIFARTTGSGREISGATYYGVMNMSDNVHEYAIFSGIAAGRDIPASLHGDGNLAPSGLTDTSLWIVSAFGLRGGCFATTGNSQGLQQMRVSCRAFINKEHNATAVKRGIRLARTAE